MSLPDVQPPHDRLWKTSKDIATRMHDIIKLHQTVLTGDEILRGRFAAIRLSDGSSDGQIYENRNDAMRHQLHADLCAYFKIPLENWSPATCDVLLWYVRQSYDAGHRPSHGGQLIIPTRLEDLL